MELSEPATAVALLYSVTDLQSIKREVTSAGDAGISVLQEWWLSDDWQKRLKGTNSGSKIVGMPTDVASSLKGLDPTNFPGLTALTLAQIRKLNLWEHDNAKVQKLTLNALDKVAGGISGALNIRQWMVVAHSERRSPTTVYLTGANWHENITKFSVSQAGWKDFNSSDLVISTGRYSYFGVSLKKKGTEQGGDPTLINKSMLTALEQVNGSYADAKESNASPTTKLAKTWMRRLENARWKTLYQIVSNTTPYQPAMKWKLPDGTNPGKMTFKQMVDKYENVNYNVGSIQQGKYNSKEEAAVRWRPSAQDGIQRYKSSTPAGGKVVINWKGAKGRSGPIREYVSSEFKKKSNAYFAMIRKLLSADDDASKELAEELTNHIFKITLGSDIDEKELGRYKFGFGLCTEIAEIRKLKEGYKVDISDGHTIELNSIVCALNKLAGGESLRARTRGYKFSVPKTDTTTTADGEGAAAIKFFIVKNVGRKVAKIVEVIIRYKGDFTAAPVFTATITDEFKHSFLKGCPPGGH